MRMTLWLVTRGIVLFVLGWCAMLAGSLVNAQDTTHEPRRSDPLREIKSLRNASAGAKVSSTQRQPLGFTGVSAAATQLPSFGHLPLVFEANNGQVDSRVQFVSRARGITTFLSPAGATFVLLKPAGTHTKSYGHMREQTFTRSVLRMRLIRANPQAKASGEERQRGQSNYFVGNSP